jgi:hypothetical protein
MANSPKIALATFGALMNGGYIRVYDGTKPAHGDTAITTQTLLAELTFGTPAFGSPSGGTITANAITADPSANATGTPTWFRAFESDGTTAVMDGTAGVSGCDLNLATDAIGAGAIVAVTDLTVSG